MKWFKGEREIQPNSGDYVVEQSVGICSLEISSCELSNSGRFSCRAENERGSDETNCTLVVEGTEIEYCGMKLIEIKIFKNVKYKYNK